MATATTRIGIIGSGIMGAGLAEVAARAGYDVTIRSRSIDSAQAVIERIDAGLAKQVAKERLTAEDHAAIIGRIEPTAALSDLAECSLIIENVVEDLEIKKQLFAELGDIVKPDTVLATNTSTLPVVELAMATTNPERVIGIHFFNPAPVMKLVEVIAPITASDETVRTATEFAASCGKDVVAVQDRAGFIVNALLFPYLNNAIRMHEMGTASLEDIDIAMQGGCGFPMGPFALLDLVGLDTSLSILDALYQEFRDPNYSPATTLRRKVAAGQLGRKTGQGFYSYS